MQSIDYLYKPHGHQLKQLLKRQKFWTMGPGSIKQQVIVGELLNVRKNKKHNYALTNDGFLLKQSSKGVCFISLLDNLVILSVSQTIDLQIEDHQKQLLCADQSKLRSWVDHLSAFCINRGMIQTRFQFINQISKGNYSKGFLVEDQMKKQFICKTFQKDDLAKVQKLRDSLIGEVLCLHKLVHKNVMRLLEVHEDNSSVYLIYESVKGELLQQFKQRKQEGRTYTEQEVGHIIRQLMEGLAHIHENKIIHRDIKLENVVFKDLNNIVIADFGLAAKVNEQFEYKKYGTPGYIAPEVLCCNRYTYKVDIFSAGVVAYILLTQQPVFAGSSISTILTNNTAGSIDFLSESFLRLSAHAKDFLKATLCLSEALRPKASECLKFDFLCQEQEDHSQTSPDIRKRELSLSYLSNTVIPQSINLNKARKKSMRQYILLKQAINIQTQKQFLTQLSQVKETQELQDDSTNPELALTVTESVNNIFNSFYTQPPAVKADHTDWDDEESLDGSESDSNMSSLDIRSDEDEDDLLSGKFEQLRILIIKHKFKVT